MEAAKIVILQHVELDLTARAAVPQRDVAVFADLEHGWMALRGEQIAAALDRQR